jgi:uncharacterized protein YbjT (DUF2867 family)
MTSTDADPNTIVITGATGNVGRPLMEALAHIGNAVTAVSRQAPAPLPAGVRHHAADLRDPATLRPALAGARALYLLLPDGGDRLDPAGIMAEVAAAGVRRVVVQSSQAAGTRPELAAYDATRGFEAAARESAQEWTILRPGGFATNTFAWVDGIRSGRGVLAPFGDVGLPIVDPADIAAMAAAVLTGDGHSGATYEVTGPSAVTPREQVGAIADAIGAPIEFVELDREQARQAMLAFMPPEIVDGTLTIFGAPTPEESRPSPDVRRVLGRDATPFQAWASRHAAVFAGSLAPA